MTANSRKSPVYAIAQTTLLVVILAVSGCESTTQETSEQATTAREATERATQGLRGTDTEANSSATTALTMRRAELLVEQGQGSEALRTLESIADHARDQDWLDLYWKALLLTPKGKALTSADTLVAQQRILTTAFGDASSVFNDAHMPQSVRTIFHAPDIETHVALVLPLDGPLEAFGNAFLEGFTTAWYANFKDTNVRFTLYDADTLREAVDYSHLASEFAAQDIDVVIGPVSRPKLASMQRALPNSLGWIALNRLPDASTLNQGQFAFELSTEDEVEALAERIRTEYAIRVLAYYSPTGWSMRAADTLEAALGAERLIGKVELSDAAKAPEEVGLSLLVDGSDARIRTIRRLLQGAVDTKARRRQDLDAVVMLVDGNLAQTLAPALRFHDAGNLQVFTTSRMIREVPADEYRILDGAAFFDLPWNLYDSEFKQQVRSEFGEVAPLIETFRAIGVDCFRLADRFNVLRVVQREGLSDVLQGASGTLRTSGTRIERQLVWSQVRSGSIEPVDAAQ